MGVILGFGVTEEQTARKIINECCEAMANGNCEEVLSGIKASYDKLEKEYKEMDKAEVPERYSYFWYHVNEIYKGKYFVEFTIHHINRRHAFSPDGWALLVTHWILSVSEDEKTIYKGI